MAVVVSDTSPIRALAHLDLLALLPGLFSEVLVPPAVDDELTSPPTGLPSVDVRDLCFVTIKAPRDRARVQQLCRELDPGESEALALAVEIGVSVVLIDESAGRKTARQLGLLPIGVLGVLIRAKQRGLIPGVLPLLDRLRSELGFFVSDQLRAEVRRLAGEP